MLKDKKEMLVETEVNVYHKHLPQLGDIYFRPFQLDTDIGMLHDWVNRPYAKYWGFENTSVAEVAKAYEDLLKVEGYEIYIGVFNEKPIFLTECYQLKNDILSKYYEVAEGDLGMHILVAPLEKKISGFTWHVFSSVMDFCFYGLKAQRVVVEPDINNEKIHVLNKKAGFVYQKEIELPHKTAHLAFCTKADFEQALAQ